MEITILYNNAYWVVLYQVRINFFTDRYLESQIWSAYVNIVRIMLETRLKCSPPKPLNRLKWKCAWIQFVLFRWPVRSDDWNFHILFSGIYHDIYRTTNSTNKVCFANALSIQNLRHTSICDIIIYGYI